MPLPPKLISATGDWFIQTRLPEFTLDWKDSRGQSHNLEIVGRHLSCREHNDAVFDGIIHFSQPDGSYPLPCLELQSHWPRIFTSGPEFRYLDSFLVNLQIGNLDIHKNSILHQAYQHVIATMINHLVTSKITLPAQPEQPIYGIHLTRSHSPVPQDEDFLFAAHELATLDHLGTTSWLAPVDLANLLATLAPIANHPKHHQLPSTVALENLVTTWKISAHWPLNAAARESEAVSPLSL